MKPGCGVAEAKVGYGVSVRIADDDVWEGVALGVGLGWPMGQATVPIWRECSAKGVKQID